MSSVPRLRRGVIERLPRYYHYIRNRLEAEGQEVVSSSQLAELLEVDDTLVRHDLAAIGVKGQPKVGFRCNVIVQTIREVMGFGDPKPAVIVGVGRLGGAIAAYRGFEEYGLRIVAGFDAKPETARTLVSQTPVEPMERLPEIVRAEGVTVAIITVPAEAAQAATDLLLAQGVRTFWNFAPLHLKVPPGVHVRNELLSVGLTQLSYLERLRKQGDRG